MIILFNPDEEDRFFFIFILQPLPLPSFLVKEIWSCKQRRNHFGEEYFNRFFNKLHSCVP